MRLVLRPFEWARFYHAPMQGRNSNQAGKGASYLRLFLYVKDLAKARYLVCMHAASSDSLPLLAAGIELKNLT